MEERMELQEKTIEEIGRLHARLDSMERSLRQHDKRSWSNTVWALVPVTAIVMWGLSRIFH